MSLMRDEAGRLSELLELVLAHHDPADKRTADLAFVSNQIQGQPSNVGAILAALLSNPEVLKALMGVLFKGGAAAQAPGPVPGVPPLYPTDLRIDLDLVDANGDPIPFTVTEQADCYQVELGGGTTNVPLRSKATLRAGYCLDGKPFRFEDQTPPALHLYHTARWIAREVGGAGRVSTLEAAGVVYRQADGKGGRIVNWNNQAEQPLEANRTGGMDVPMKFPPESDEAVVEVTLEVDTPSGVVRHDKPVRFPKAS